jgi:hypothetical protein
VTHALSSWILILASTVPAGDANRFVREQTPQQHEPDALVLHGVAVSGSQTTAEGGQSKRCLSWIFVFEFGCGL